MVATTYSGAGIAGSVDTVAENPVKIPARRSKGLWWRLFAAVAESQMKRAERELAFYRHLLPDDYERSQARREDQPFGGW